MNRKSDNQTIGNLSGIRIGRIPAAEVAMRSEDSHVITHYYPAILEGFTSLSRHGFSV